MLCRLSPLDHQFDVAMLIGCGQVRFSHRSILYSYSDLFDASNGCTCHNSIELLNFQTHRTRENRHINNTRFSFRMPHSNWWQDANQCFHTWVDVWLSCGCHIQPAIESIIWLPTSHFWICYLCASSQSPSLPLCLNQCKKKSCCPIENGMRIESTNQFSYANYDRFECTNSLTNWLSIHLPAVLPAQRINRRLMTWIISCSLVTAHLPTEHRRWLMCVCTLFFSSFVCLVQRDFFGNLL